MIYKGQYKSKASYFQSRTISTVRMKFNYFVGTCFTKLRLLLHIVFIINTFFPTLLEVPRVLFGPTCAISVLECAHNIMSQNTQMTVSLI
jgi:hypothetical protein